MAFATNNESVDLLIKRADTALYDAKTAGKGTFRFATIDTIGQRNIAAGMHRSSSQMCD
ncbi:hypothetical protein P0D72_17870 [Paraburkholderia sediminicola]|uniref:hypothetical protein n=1 Tax=Paraburkholderia sediminicola TaxID=458836 RepID=UPI0038BD7708